MKSIMKRKLLPSVMAFAFTGLGFSGGAQAVHLAEDGIGQVLLAPLYIALQDSYTTKVAITNTRTDVAVKAKVVFRSQGTSAEVLDFICYLTPSDVCVFEIRNIDGQATLYSDDDSVRSFDVSGAPTFASVNPISQRVFDDNLGPDDTNEVGHIEVIGAYAVGGTVNTPSGNVAIFPSMSKVALANIFDEDRVALDLLNSPAESSTMAISRDASGVLRTGNDGNGEVFTSSINQFGTRIRSTDPTWVQLLGQVTMNSTVNKDRIAYRMAALAGEVGDNVPPNNTVFYPSSSQEGIQGTGLIPFDGRVISNPFYDAQGAANAPESSIGFNFGGAAYGRATSVYDNIIELETALATTHIINTYEDDGGATPTPGINRTQLVITFPTKYRHFRNDVCGVGMTYDPEEGEVWSAPFQLKGPVPYNLTQYDNQENSISIRGFFSGSRPGEGDSLPNEVNYFIPDWAATQRDDAGNILPRQLNYDSGWFAMNFVDTAGNGNAPAGINSGNRCPYPGLPTLSMAHKYQVTDGNIDHSILVPNSHRPAYSNYRFPGFGRSNTSDGLPISE